MNSLKIENKSPGLTGLEIAVIGMAGRFPGAKNIEQFWENLKNGVESISIFSDDRLEKSGIDPVLYRDPRYVKAKGILADVEYFDAAFFEYIPNEARVMDPQMRLFHECAWEALENAGYEPGEFKGKIGMYGGASDNFYWQALVFLSGAGDMFGDHSLYQLISKEYLTTRVSFKLNLRGPSFLVQTACSTSLVAIHLACQGLLNGECAVALAGGVSITVPQESGYIYREGIVLSPDGHCRAFDAEAKGFVGGNGVGVVVLKPLEEARRDGDFIHAIIKGSAINNDGNQKAGFTAPSVKAQASVIKAALSIGEIDPETIGYVEAHGTGTALGDPIEIEALKRAFNTPKKGYCKIGSVKTNVGHLDAAAGVTGFIKTVFILEHRLIPPSLHFKTPNPQIDFENSPFIVNTRLHEWKKTGHPLRAGVSSFGIGGTNAHVILEEAPVEIRDSEGTRGLAPLSNRQYQLILLSAKTELALEKMTQNLVEYFKDSLLNHGNRENPVNPGLILADAAYTLQVGRRALPYRRMTITQDVDGAIAALAAAGTGKVRTSHVKNENPPVIFMFPGQGSQYIDMGLGLYKTKPVFRQEMDRCFGILKPLLNLDIKEIIYLSDRSDRSDRSDNLINRTEIAQPLLFSIEYALAKLLMSLGIEPYAMIGHSIGEYTAACLAGVFSLEDALKIVVIRGKSMQQMPTGSMLSIPLPEEELKPLLNEKISLAAVNSTSRCVVSGESSAIDSFKNKLHEMGYESSLIHTSHAFHSAMMDPILTGFKKQINSIRLNKPKIPYISNITGHWIKAEDAADTGYWAKHIRSTVRFSKGIETLLEKEPAVFIEVGPGDTLSTFVKQHKNKKTSHLVLDTVRHPKDQIRDDYFLIGKMGQLWLYGIKIDWTKLYPKEKRFRIPLPLYPFERKRYWIDSDPVKAGKTMMGNPLTRKKPDRADWFYTQQWLRSPLTAKQDSPPSQSPWLLFIDDTNLGNRLVKRLEDENHRVVVVQIGESFSELKPDRYAINPGNPGDYEILFKGLEETGNIPGNIVHLWGVSGSREHDTGLEFLDRRLDLGLYSLLFTAGAISSTNIPGKIQLGVITSNMQYVNGEEELCPGKAAILGPVKIIPLEYPNISCRSIDILDPGKNKGKIEFIIDNLLREFSTGFGDQPVVAYRGACRWEETYEPVKLDLNQTTPQPPRLKEKGVYLVTGGFGGMGFVLAEHLANTLKARLILVDILTPPTEEKLDTWLYSNERKKDTRDKKQKIKEWETRGAEILVYDMDVSNYQGMKNVITQAEERYGQINGVIHTAGLIDYAGVIQRRTREMTGALLAAKIKGTLVLDELLGHHQLDFMVLFSSIGNVFYKIKFGQVGYNAGHEFLDVFSYYKQQQGRFTVTIDWNDWTQVGMAVRAAHRRNADSSSPPGNRTGSENIENILSISPEEGIDVFQRIVENNLNRVVVYHHDLHRSIEVMNNPAQVEAQTGSSDGTEENTVSLHERPGLSTDYIPPSNELEQFIIDIWEKNLGYKKIGIMDDWFDLGGDSLMLTQLISRVKEVYPVDISLNIFFKNPTAARLAEMIEELLLEKVRDLSEEELDALTGQDIL